MRKPGHAFLGMPSRVIVLDVKHIASRGLPGRFHVDKIRFGRAFGALGLAETVCVRRLVVFEG